MQGVQAVIVHILIFVSWKKGPNFWLNVAPKLFYALSIVLYIIVPISICFYTDRRWDSIMQDPNFLQLFVCFIV